MTDRQGCILISATGQRLIDKSGFPSTISYTTDIEEAVKDAKYVLNHIRVGRMEARVRDERLPPEFGMAGDESLGAGGFANAIGIRGAISTEDAVGATWRAASSGTATISGTPPIRTR